MATALITPISERWGVVRAQAVHQGCEVVVVEFDGQIDWLPLDEVARYDLDNLVDGNSIVEFSGYEDSEWGRRTRFWLTMVASELLPEEERKPFLYGRLAASHGLRGGADPPAPPSPVPVSTAAFYGLAGNRLADDTATLQDFNY